MSPQGGALPSHVHSLPPSFLSVISTEPCACLTAPTGKLSLSHRGSMTLSWSEQSGEPAPRCLPAPALVLASAQCRLEQAPCRQVEGGEGPGQIQKQPTPLAGFLWLCFSPSAKFSLCRKHERLKKREGAWIETAKQGSEQDSIIPSPEARRRAGSCTHPGPRGLRGGGRGRGGATSLPCFAELGPPSSGRTAEGFPACKRSEIKAYPGPALLFVPRASPLDKREHSQEVPPPRQPPRAFLRHMLQKRLLLSRLAPSSICRFLSWFFFIDVLYQAFPVSLSHSSNTQCARLHTTPQRRLPG